MATIPYHQEHPHHPHDLDEEIVAIKQGTATFKSCAAGHHGRCKHHDTFRTNIKVVGKQGETQRRTLELVHTVCDCVCHQRQPLQCLECGDTGSELSEIGFCTQESICFEAAEARLEGNETWQRYQRIRAAARAAEAEKREAQRNDSWDSDRPRPRKTRGEGRPTSGTCHHCGAPTKGGKFVAGHDAKLKGELVAAAKTGDVDAVLEILCREWPTKSLEAYKTGPAGKKIATGQKLLAKAGKQFDKMSGVQCEEFLAERNAARAARYQEQAA